MTTKEKILFLEESGARPQNSKKSLWKTDRLWLAWWAMENDMHCLAGFSLMDSDYFCFIWPNMRWSDGESRSFILPPTELDFPEKESKKQFYDFCLRVGHAISGHDILTNDWEKLHGDIVRGRAEWRNVDKLILVAQALRLIPGLWADNMRRRISIGQNL